MPAVLYNNLIQALATNPLAQDIIILIEEDINWK